MIRVELHNESIEALHDDLRQLLAGASVGTIAAVANTGVSGGANSGGNAEATGRRPSGRTRAGVAAAAALATEKPNISTGEERIDPEADKQDAADEASDSAKAKAAEPTKLTHDDVKKMLGGYVMAYGMEAAQADGVGFIGAPKLSSIPDTQADLAKAILGIAAGIEKNPNKREIAGDGITAEKLAELKPVVAAAVAAT
jgi:hypothetical protein